MMGRKRPQPPPAANGQSMGGGRTLVGVRLMQEPGFAAHDSHLYRRQPPGGPFLGARDAPHSLMRLSTGEIVALASPVDEREKPTVPPHSEGATCCSENRHETTPREDPSRERTSSRDPSRRRRRGKTSSGVPLEGVRLGTDFRHAVSRFACPVPQALIKALSAREPAPAIGKVHVSLRVTPSIPLPKGETSIISLDKKRRQVTIVEPKTTHTHERVGVSAPKMFAFDQVYSHEDEQSAVVSRVLPDILQAVLGGTDGCVLCFGGSGMGKTHTMVGSHLSAGELGVMPTALSWLYQAIAHLKASKAARFSVRASAIVVDAPGRQIADVLGDFAQENETSPGALLRQGSSGLLSLVAELRAPFPETAARYLDLALSARSALSTGSSRSTSGPTTLLFTLHVYQYTIDKAQKGRVLGGRSRLHLIDLGDMSGGHSEGLTLSGLTSVLLAIFNGHKYLPHKFNRLTQLLQEILGSVTCHAAMIVHVSASARHAQHTLATLQLASRVHRLRRKKIRGLGGSSSSGSSEGSRRRSSGSETSAGSSSLDFSSSEQSADTVIYIGGGGPGDSSDGEHPPIFFPHHIRRHRSVELPRLRSFEQLRPHTASPHPVVPKRPISVSPTPTSRSVPSDKTRVKPTPPPRHNSVRSLPGGSATGCLVSNPLQSGFFRHQPGVSHIIYPTQGDREPLGASFGGLEKDPVGTSRNQTEGEKQGSYKYYQQPNTMVPVFQSSQGQMPPVATSCQGPQRAQEVFSHVLCSAPSHTRRVCSEVHGGPVPLRQGTTKGEGPPPSDEHWIDGPRISRSRVHAAKNNKLCQSETWVDGPSSEKGGTGPGGSYGFMDDHKKTMIERWVEIQTAQVVTQTDEAAHNIPGPSMSQIPGSAPVSPPEATHQTLTISNSEELNLESDVDTLSEDHSGAMPPSETKQPSLIEELEKKNLIPLLSAPSHEGGSTMTVSHGEGAKVDRASEGTHFGDDRSIEEVCSQCEAMAEECEEELQSLLSCEEEECKRQVHNGLATVVEEPELESAFGGDDPIDAVSLLNNPQTDCEDTGGPSSEADLDNTARPHEVTVRTGTKAPLSLRKVVDVAVQVCEEDIARLLSSTPCPSDMTAEASDDHPLRVLSEENLTCASTFTDSCSQIGETGDEEEASDEEDESRPFSLLEASEYGKICEDLSAALQSEAADRDLRELANIHRLFSAFTRHQPPNQPESLFTPNLFPHELSNRNHQPRSLPAAPNPFTHMGKDRVISTPPSALENGSCVECNANNKGAQNPMQESQRREKPTSRHSLDKCTGTDDNSPVSNRITEHLPDNANASRDPNFLLRYFGAPSEALLLSRDVAVQNNFNTSCLPKEKMNATLTATTTSTKEGHVPIPSHTNAFNLSKYISDSEHNLLLFDPSSLGSCQNCEDNYHRSCDILLTGDGGSPPNHNENDSDCPSSVSEDSEYLVQQSKFSKFLCVGIGRSKSSKASSTKGGHKASNKNNGDGKKVLFKLRGGDAKSKVIKSREVFSKSPPDPLGSKNSVGSPSRVLSRSEDELTNRLDVTAGHPLQKPEVDLKSLTVSDEGGDLKCPCRNLATPSSPQGRHPSRLEFCPGTSSSSTSSKDWGASPLSLVSPQLCTDVPSGGAPKGGHPHPMTTSGSLGTTQSLGESSGYESIPRDSECSSFSSSQESEMDEEHRKFLSQGHVQRGAGATAPPGDTTEVSRVEAIVQNSFLKHLTKKSSTKTEAKLVSSTTWKYRC